MKKGQLCGAAPSRLPFSLENSTILDLRDVVAERRPDHVVHRLRRNCRRARRQPAATGPSALSKIGVLKSPAEAAFRSLIQLMPEPKGSLHDDAGVPGTGTTPGWRELIGRRILRAATRVIGEWRTVSTDLV